MDLEVVYAIHPFEAENDDEISFDLGDPITVLEKDDMYGDGWWQGRTTEGKVGLFPVSYTSPNGPGIDKDGSYNNLTMTPTNILNSNDSDLDMPLPPFRMNSPSSIDETIDDIQEKLQKMSVRMEGQSNQIKMGPYQYPWSPKNGRHSKLFFSSSGSNSSHSSRKSSPGVLENLKRPESVNNFGTPSPTKIATPMPVAPSPTELVMSSPTELVASSSPVGSNTEKFEAYPLNWDVQQVCSWLEEKGFKNEIPNFIENDITGDVLLQLSLSTLKELSIASFGKRVHIMDAINSLKAQYSIVELGLDDDVSDIEEHIQKHSESYQMYPQNSYYNSSMDNKGGSVTFMTPTPPHVRMEDPKIEFLGGDAELQKNNTNNFYAHESTQSRKIEDANAELASEKSTIKKSRSIFSRLQSFTKSNKDKRSSDTSKHKARAASTNGGWDFFVDDEYNGRHEEKRKYHKSKNKSVGDEPSLGLELEKEVGSMYTVKKRLPSERNSVIESRHSDYENFQNLETIDDITGMNEEIMRAIEEPDYEGWLKKQGLKYKTWNSRYCILKGTDLYYFKTDKAVNGPKVKGHIDLAGYRIYPDENLLHGKYGFKLVHDTMRTHYFAHEDVEKMRGWMKAMMKATISRDNKAPVVSSSIINTVPLAEARKMSPRPPQPGRSSLTPTAATKVTSPILRSTSPYFSGTTSPPPYTVPSVLSPPLEPIVENTPISPKIRPYNNTNRSISTGFF
ncbi:5001_t:CDS:10 [Acaulospora colombiana]|uniref:5001_t:CDS:1 n=1 Tax=Acaulospora colombiana TaxID=27376 RepID=A0ACA9M5K9_9GLOM|nr:5001_t:CDS:10 [Acaulospora colombiana]